MKSKVRGLYGWKRNIFSPTILCNGVTGKLSWREDKEWGVICRVKKRGWDPELVESFTETNRFVSTEDQAQRKDKCLS